jgi:hypothetical protein
MNIAMNLFIYSSNNFKNEKNHKYIHLHKNVRNKAKVFRKQYDIQKSLQIKEYEAYVYCNIFNDYNDEKCMNTLLDIELLELKLKKVNKKLICLKGIEETFSELK